jgi:hypothetical protein
VNCGHSTGSSSTTEFSVSSGWELKAVGGEEWGGLSTVELQLSGLIGTTGHPDMQIIRIIGFFFENSLHWHFEVKKILRTAVLSCIFIYVQIEH